MSEISVILNGYDVAIRLLITITAMMFIGVNRGEGGHAAGLRTTMLVGLAASVAMINANILLGTTGKQIDSFVSIDVMRLPLGILTGVGFIGAGTILRRGGLVRGLTTAATLWMATVIGLCCGSGQILLGLIATLLTILTLWGLEKIDMRMKRWQKATLVISGPDQLDIAGRLPQKGYSIQYQMQERIGNSDNFKYKFSVSWRGVDASGFPSDIFKLNDATSKITLLSIDREDIHCFF